MKVVFHNDKIIGKTKSESNFGSDFVLIEFDPTIESHKKCKFINSPPEISSVEKINRSSDSAWNFMIELGKSFGGFQSIEACKKASNSELKRWLENKAVVVNGEPLQWDEVMDFPINSMVLFPNGARRCTLV